jgi:hypothetical protein
MAAIHACKLQTSTCTVVDCAQGCRTQDFCMLSHSASSALPGCYTAVRAIKQVFSSYYTSCYSVSEYLYDIVFKDRHISDANSLLKEVEVL